VLCNVFTFTAHIIAKLKRHRQFLQYLKDRELLLFEHPFKSFELSRVGFFSGKNYKRTYLPYHIHRIKHIVNKSVTGNEDIHFTPAYVVNPRKIIYIKQNSDGTKTKYSTEALEIECEPEHLTTMQDLLVGTDFQYNEFGKFVPYTTQHNDPQLFIDKIIENNQHFTDYESLNLFGWHETLMDAKIENEVTVRELLTTHTHNGIHSLEYHSSTTSEGKWTLIIHKDHKKQIIEAIENIVIPAAAQLEEYTSNRNNNEHFTNGLSISNSQHRTSHKVKEYIRNMHQIERNQNDHHYDNQLQLSICAARK
jgi:hypothetical protein